jgi:hypothetical protein
MLAAQEKEMIELPCVKAEAGCSDHKARLPNWVFTDQL